MALGQISHTKIMQLVYARLGAPVSDGGANLLVIPRTHPDPELADVVDGSGIASWSRLMHANVAQQVRHEEDNVGSTLPATGTATIHLLVHTSTPGPASDIFAHEKYLDTVIEAINGRFLHSAKEGAVTAEMTTTVHVTHFETIAMQGGDDKSGNLSLTHLILHARVHGGVAVG